MLLAVAVFPHCLLEQHSILAECAIVWICTRFIIILLRNSCILMTVTPDLLDLSLKPRLWSELVRAEKALRTQTTWVLWLQPGTLYTKECKEHKIWDVRFTETASKTCFFNCKQLGNKYKVANLQSCKHEGGSTLQFHSSYLIIYWFFYTRSYHL